MNQTLTTRSRFVVTASILSIIAASFSNTALYSIMLPMRHELHFSLTMLLAIILSFHIIESALFILSGRLGERFHFFKIYILGVVLSFTGLLLIAIAQNGVMVLIGRIIGGFGNGLAITNSVALIMITVPEEKRDHTMSLWLGAATLAFALGPFAGGLCDLSSWRIVYAITMLLNLIAFSCVIIGRKALPKLPGKPQSLDLFGNSLYAIFMVSVIIIFSMSNLWSWSSAPMITFIVIAPVALLFFLCYERFAKAPILVYSLLKKRNFSIALVVALVCGAALFASMYFYNLFVQNPSGLQYRPWIAGVTLLPLNISVFILSLFIAHIAKRTGMRCTFVIGGILMSVGFLTCFWLSSPVVYSDLWWRILLIGLGAGFMFPMATPLGMREVPIEHTGIGSGWINSAVMFGASVSIPLAQIFYLKKALHGVSQLPAWQHLSTNTKQILTTSLTTNSIHPTKVLDAVHASDASTITRFFHTSIVGGFNNAMLVLAIFAFIGLGVSLFIKRAA